MNKPFTFTTPSGDTMAVLPLAEYEQLVEAAEDRIDQHIYDSAMARIASGEDELVPSALVQRLMAGENSVRVWREYREMSLSTLAKNAGLSPSYLSQIERGQRAGTLASMKRIAEALRISLDDL